MRGIRYVEKFWAVTCKRCENVINFAAINPDEPRLDIAQPDRIIQCPRCREKRRYHCAEVWRNKVPA